MSADQVPYRGTDPIWKGVEVTKEQAEEWFSCLDCRSVVVGYMVNHEVWKLAVPNYAELKKKQKWVNICLRCLEKRIGRDLVIHDFSGWPINEPIRVGFRMGLYELTQRQKGNDERRNDAGLRDEPEVGPAEGS